MKTIAIDQARAQIGQLNLVFSDAVVTREFSADATFGDIARILRKLPKWRYGSPVSIHVTFDSAPPAGLLSAKGDALILFCLARLSASSMAGDIR